MWDNDSKARFIQYDPTCSISLMPVNQDNKEYAAFIEKYSDKMVDKIWLLQDGVCIGENSAGAIATEK